MKLHGIAFVLVVIGGLNWGLVAIGYFMGQDWNVVKLLINSWSPMIENLVYLLVGLSAVNLLISHKSDCRTCSTGGASGMGM